jgi:hypothetical protein
VTTDLPAAEFGFPGPLRDRLVAAVLDDVGLRPDRR